MFPVEININETNDKLLPGLTVSCRVIVGTIKNAMYVPLDAVHSEGDVSYVYKKTAKGFEKAIVKTGVSNADFVVVTKGLSLSDKLAMADPFKKEDKTKDKTAKADVSAWHAIQKKVMPGQAVGDKVMIKSGLEDGDKLIVDGVQKLHDGSLIAVGGGEQKKEGGH